MNMRKIKKIRLCLFTVFRASFQSKAELWTHCCILTLDTGPRIPTHAAELFFLFFFVRVLAERKALCSWLGVGLRVKWEGTMFLLILSDAKFIGYHLQGGGVWLAVRPKKGF